MNDAAQAADPGPDLAPAPEPAIDAGEITLELGLPAAAAAKLWRTRTLATYRAGRTRTQPVRIDWHDEPDGGPAQPRHVRLDIRHGASRQVRREVAARDGRLVWPLGTPAPSDDGAGPVVEAADAPAPIAVFEGHRRRPALSAEGGLAELTLLDGTLTVGTARLDVARLSLRGTSRAVFAIARALLEELPLFVPPTSLSGEVLAARHGAVCPAIPVLRSELEVDDAFAHVVSQLAATLAHHAPGARAGRATEPVHQMRVALRRLRSALSLFRRVASSPELDRVRVDLGALARALGPARDWDVFLAGTGKTVTKLLPQERAVVRLGAAARRRRKAAYADLTGLLDAPAFQATLLDLVELATVRPWRREADQDRPRLVAFARQALDRKLRRIVEAGEDLSPLPVAELHAVRIHCKRLRYAAEFFAPLMPGRQTRRFLRRLAAVQERLGQLNDGAVAGDLLAELGGRGFAAGIVHGYLAARSAGSRAKAEKSWRRFRRVDPFWH